MKSRAPPSLPLTWQLSQLAAFWAVYMLLFIFVQSKKCYTTQKLVRTNIYICHVSKKKNLTRKGHAGIFYHIQMLVTICSLEDIRTPWNHHGYIYPGPCIQGVAMRQSWGTTLKIFANLMHMAYINAILQYIPC